MDRNTDQFLLKPFEPHGLRGRVKADSVGSAICLSCFRLVCAARADPSILSLGHVLPESNPSQPSIPGKTGEPFSP